MRSRMSAGLAIMGSETIKLGIYFSESAAIGRNEFIDFSLAHAAPIAGHGGGFRAKVFGCRAVDALGLERVPAHGFRHTGFSERTITTHLPHLAHALDLDRTELPIVEITNFRF